MVTTDKVISLGMNAALTAGYYALGKTEMPAKALYSHLGGIAASSLFQAYYPDYCHQMREELGENFTWAATWLYPGMILLAGYVGGVSTDINFFVTSYFCILSVTTVITWDIADNRVFKEIDRVLADARGKTNTKQLLAAGTAIKQAEDLSQRLTRIDQIGSWRFGYIDDRKKGLSNAYLALTKPKFDEAEKWARAIKSPKIKYTALQTLGMRLLKEERSEKTGTKIEGLVQECEKLLFAQSIASHFLDPFLHSSESFFTFKFAFAKKYEKTALQTEVRESLSTLGESANAICVLFELAKAGIKQGDKAFTKHCIALAESCIAKFEENENSRKWGSMRFINLTSKEIVGPQRFDRMGGIGSLKSRVAYLFIRVALAIGDMEAAMRFFKTDMLDREDRIVAEMETAQVKSQDSPEESRGSVTRAIQLIREYTLPEDVEERGVQISEYLTEAFLRVVEYQMDFDIEGAYQTAQNVLPNDYGLQLSIAGQAKKPHVELSRRIVSDVEAQFAKLSFADRLHLMRLQMIVAPETLFTSYERHEAIWETASPIEQAKALLILAEGHLSRDASRSAGPLLARAEALGDGHKDVQAELSRLRAWNSSWLAPLF